jgi:hypothetical protein
VTAPIGAVVGLYIDTTARVLPDQYIRTDSGRTYQVLTVRTQQRGKHAGTRQHLRVLVVPESTPAEGDVVVPIRWYPRNKRAR